MPEIERVVKYANGRITATPKLYDRIPARLVLYLLLTFAVTCSSVMRSVLPITILAMVKNKSNDSMHTNYTKSNNSYKPISYGGTLDWSLDAQYYVLTSFYWTYIVTQVIGGVTVQRFGTKVTLGFALLLTSVCNMLIPVASGVHYVFVVVLQLMQGVLQGFVWPSIYSIISHWVPLHERSRFVSCFQGQGLGYALGNFATGFIIAKFGWSYAFYSVACLGLLWCLLWYSLCHDKPENHPRILLTELLYIRQNRGKASVANKKIPWKGILCSVPMWAIAITSFGRMWLTSTTTVYGNLILKDVVGLSVEMNGVFGGIISISSSVTMLFFGFIADKLVRSTKISLVANRKLFSGIGHIGAGICAIMISYSDCNGIVILVLMWLIAILSVASFSGAMVNIVDISPTFTGPVSSVIQVVLMTPSIFAPAIAKTLLINKPAPESWETIFHISGWVVLGTYVIYLIFASSDVQPWDHCDNPQYSNQEADENEQESSKL